ncbi:energy transducer TonB [Colwelliaceae bacterium BS250]
MKFIIPIFLGALISFALFAIMASLVAKEEVYIEEIDDWAVITIINQPEDSEVHRKNRTLAPPPKPITQPKGDIKVDAQQLQTKSLPVHVSMTEVNVDLGLSDQEFAIGIIKDNQAMPIYRALPRYPIAAARNKIKGWVKLSFSINREGEVEDVMVIESEPEKIFDQAAIDALKHWRYKPQLNKGKTVKQQNLSVRIDFGKK